MKYPIALLVVLLLSSVYSQELIVDTLNNAYTSGSYVAKSWQNPQWDNYLDFAIYGWMKIGSQYARNEWATAIHFTSNGDNWQDLSSYGDRLIALFTINNILHCPTYSFSRGTANYVDNVLYQPADLDKWAFFYLSHGSATQSQFSYFRLAGSGAKILKYTSITHFTSSFYQIRVGQSFSYRYFPGQLWRVSIVAGPNAYKETGFEVFQNLKPDQAPTCVTLYTGCGFTGKATSVCDKNSQFNVNSIQSIFVPQGQSFTLYETSNYNGRKIVYKQSVECITSFNWAMFVESEVEEKKKPALRSSKKSTKRN